MTLANVRIYFVSNRLIHRFRCLGYYSPVDIGYNINIMIDDTNVLFGASAITVHNYWTSGRSTINNPTNPRHVVAIAVTSQASLCDCILYCETA